MQQLSGATTSAAAEAAAVVFSRAYRVVWTLQGFGERDSLGWIAVSGEDDPPHRPVNVPSAPFPQHDLTVNVQPNASANGRQVRTRFVIARPGDRPRSSISREQGVSQRRLPPAQAPSIWPSDRLLIFVHGHDSRLEECLPLVNAVSEQGFVIVAMDLPCNGYASMFDHTGIAPDTDTDQLERFPILEFLEQFVIDFVLALESRVGRPIQQQVAAVIGGSLGGNLGLRLARRDLRALPFLTNVVVWSAACTWSPLTGLIKEAGPNTTRARMQQDRPTPRDSAEPPGRRREFFYQAFEESHPVFYVYPQPTYWYRDGWPCKGPLMSGARADRQEMYNPFFRRWHWRVAMEQLLFSHRTPANREQITGRTLLIAGEADNYPWTNIYLATRDLATEMVTTPGTQLLMRWTGHSIYVERSNELARVIHDFLPPPRPEGDWRESWSGWQSLDGQLTSPPVVAMNEDGRLEVFARGTDDQIWNVSQARPNGEWNRGWGSPKGGLDQNDRFGSHIAASTTHDGRQEVFAQLTGPHWIAHVWQNEPNGGWHSWDKGGVGQLIGGAEDAVAVAQRAGDTPFEPTALELHVYEGSRVGVPRRWLLVTARRTNGMVHIRGSNNSGWWTNGRDLGWQAHDYFVGTPVLTHQRDGRLIIFSRDEAGSVHFISEESSDHWHDWWQTLVFRGVTGDVAVARDIGGYLCLFARNIRGELLYKRQLTPNSDDSFDWGMTGSLGGSLAEGATPAVALNGWGEMQVFVRWQDGSIRYRRQHHSHVWYDWETLGGSAIFDPAVGVNADGRLVVFHVGRDRRLYYSIQGTRMQIPIIRWTRAIVTRLGGWLRNIILPPPRLPGN